MATLNGVKVNNARMFDKYLYDASKGELKENPSTKQYIYRFLQEMDKQEFIERFKWEKTPKGIDSELIERIMFYRGNGIIFYMKENKTFYFLPFALSGKIDIYGRYLGVTPLPFAGPTAIADKNGNYKPWIDGLVKYPIYEVPEEITDDLVLNGCIILNDRSKGLSQLVDSRFELNKPILDIESEMIPLLRTNLIATSGVKALRVPDESCKDNVKLVANEIYGNAMEGNPFTATVGTLDFQDLTSSSLGTKPEAFLMAMQSLENLRLSGMGLKSGGLFQKKAHELQSESDINDGVSSIILDNELSRRKLFCEIFNKVFADSLGLEHMTVRLNEKLNQEGLNDSENLGYKEQNKEYSENNNEMEEEE